MTKSQILFEFMSKKVWDFIIILWPYINFMQLKAGNFKIWFTPLKNDNMRLQLHYYVVYYLSNQPPPPATGQNPTAFQGWRLARHYTFLFLLEPTTFAQCTISQILCLFTFIFHFIFHYIFEYPIFAYKLWRYLTFALYYFFRAKIFFAR